MITDKNNIAKNPNTQVLSQKNLNYGLTKVQLQVYGHKNLLFSTSDNAYYPSSQTGSNQEKSFSPSFYQSPLQVVKIFSKDRRSRYEQSDATHEQNSVIFDRRSEYARKKKIERTLRKIRKEQIQEGYLYISICNQDFAKKREEGFHKKTFTPPSNVSYLYNNINITHRDRYTTKKIVSSEIEPPTLWGQDPGVGYELLKKIKKQNYLRYIRFVKRRSMQHDNESQPNYVQQQQQQKTEMSRSIYAIKPPSGYEKILITNAKRLVEHIERGITTRSIALRKLGILKRDCPQAIPSFKQWMNTQEGRKIMSTLSNPDL